MKESRFRPWLLCTASPLLHGSRPRMAHQTAAPRRVQPRLLRRGLGLGTTMKKGAAWPKKKKKGRKAGHKQFPEYGTTCETENKMQHNTQAHAVAAHTYACGWIGCCLQLWGIRGKGVVEENNKRGLNYSEF